MNRPLDLPLIFVDLSRQPDFSIGTLGVCPSHRQVSANGHRETVQPRVMQVLVALTRAKGAVLSRDNLIEACWDGVVVGDDAINRCIAKVRQIAELGGGLHFEIETIPRVGYRLAPIDSPGSIAQTIPAGDKSPAPPANAQDVALIRSGSAPTRHFLPSRGRIMPAPAYLAIGLLIVAVIGILLAWPLRSPAHAPPATHRNPLLAVLPFRNLSADAGSRYFSDGITQEIIDALLQITEIRVAAPASSFALRDAGIPRFARALAATHVLSGSVEQHARDLRVIAQVSDIARNRVIWSRIYRTTVAQTPALQHHIAMQIANALDMRMSSRALSEAAQIDPVAYDHYLRGRDLFRQRGDLLVAEKELETSVLLTPGFAKAWSTLAAVRYLKANWFDQIKKDSAPVFKEARSAANRALALDPDNAEALGVLAATSAEDRVAADRLFERGLRAEPNNTQLLNWHHIFLLSVGRNREASDEIERAYELDRLAPAIIYNAATTFAERGDFERARQIMDLGIAYCSPEIAFDLRAQYLLSMRDWSGLAQHLGTSPPGLNPQIVSVYRSAGETNIALANGQSDKFAALRTRWRTQTVGDRVYAVTFLTLFGDTEGALKVIDTTLAAGASLESQLLFTPALPALRRDPGAKALMAKWGLFEYWRRSNHWPDFCEEPGLPFDCKAEAQKLRP